MIAWLLAFLLAASTAVTAPSAHDPRLPANVPTGILNVTASPFSTAQYLVSNSWQDLSPDGRHWLAVYAVQRTGPRGRGLGRGLLVVNVLPAHDPSGRLIGNVHEYRPPGRRAGFSIVAVRYPLFVVSGGRFTGTFDLKKRAWTSTN